MFSTISSCSYLWIISCSKHLEAKEKPPEWHEVLNMSLRLLKPGFRTYRRARKHTGTVVTDYAIEGYRGEDIQLHSFFTSALWGRWSTSRPPPLGEHIHIYIYNTHTHTCAQSEKYQYAWHTMSLLLRNSKSRSITTDIRNLNYDFFKTSDSQHTLMAYDRSLRVSGSEVPCYSWNC